MALLTALSAPGSIAAEETATEPVIIEDMEEPEDGGTETETAEITETEIPETETPETETPETENSGIAGTGTVTGDTAVQGNGNVSIAQRFSGLCSGGGNERLYGHRGRPGG